MTAPLGLTGDPNAFVTTPDLADRMGYPSMDAWYRDARRRAASGFPPPRRRGVWRLGDLQDWDERGGLSRARASPAPTLPANDIKPSKRARPSQSTRMIEARLAARRRCG